jgi:ribosomal protein L7/L12
MVEHRTENASVGCSIQPLGTVAQQYRAVVALIRAGKSISAVRQAQKVWGLGLKEAKDLVEAIIETHFEWDKGD